MSDGLHSLNLVMKTLSMRRENLYRAVDINPAKARSLLAEIGDIDEEMTRIEAQRSSMVRRLAHGESA